MQNAKNSLAPCSNFQDPGMQCNAMCRLSLRNFLSSLCVLPFSIRSLARRASSSMDVGSGATVAAELAKNQMLVNAGAELGKAEEAMLAPKWQLRAVPVPVQQRPPAAQCLVRWVVNDRRFLVRTIFFSHTKSVNNNNPRSYRFSPS